MARAAGPSVQPGGGLRQSGLDRITHVEDITTFKSGDTVLELAIVPGVGERLGKFASLFQRVRYDALRVEIRAQAATSTSGGYVVGFVRDPDDFAPTVNVLSYLTGQAGSKTANWWQSVVLNVGRTPDLFYTSEPSTRQIEMRTLSPGKLVIACDGKATGGGSLTVLLHWTVTLLEPSMEAGGATGPASITLALDYAFWDDQNNEELTSKVALVLPGDPSTKREYVTPA